MFDNSTLPQFTHLYSVSDLHMGGYTGAYGDEPRDFRIFNQCKALTWLINHVADIAVDCPETALVLNGDVVDFLACENATAFDPVNARHNLQGIIHDPSFHDIWDALRNFVRQKKGVLVIVLGNHDVELALPNVQHYLVKYLTGGDQSARSHLVLALDGNGYRCRVGEADVLLIHGNEVDEFNAVDYGALQRVSRAINFDSARMPPYRANAGSTLVTAAMNDIKRRFQWIDLLKPEQEAAIRILAALPRDLFHEIPLRRAIESVLKIAQGATKDAKRIRKGLLSLDSEEMDESDHDARIADTVDHIMNVQILEGPRSDDAQHLLNMAKTYFNEGRRPEELLPVHNTDESPGEGKLGIGEIWNNRHIILNDVGTPFISNLQKKKDLLRSTLKQVLEFDVSFSATAAPDPWLDKFDQRVGTSLDFLIAGHTHFEKSLERLKSGTFYFNSGTWIRLIDLANKLDSPDTFDKVWHILLQGSMGCLDGVEGAPFAPEDASDSEYNPNSMCQDAISITKIVRTVVHLTAAVSPAANCDAVTKYASTVTGRLEHVIDRVLPNNTTEYSLETVPNTERVWNRGCAS